MKKIGLNVSLVFALILSFQSMNAQDYKSGIGLRIGTYFALSYKYLNKNNAFEAVAGIRREGGRSIIALGAFYQRHRQLTNDIPTLKWYYGGGLFLGVGSNEVQTTIAATASIGLEYTLENAPFIFFIDGIPYIDITNNGRFDTEASLGVRYLISGQSK